MGRRIRSFPGLDRFEINGKPVGLQCFDGRHFVRRLSVVHLFHGTEAALKAISNTGGSAGAGQPEWAVTLRPVADPREMRARPC